MGQSEKGVCRGRLDGRSWSWEVELGEKKRRRRKRTHTDKEGARQCKETSRHKIIQHTLRGSTQEQGQAHCKENHGHKGKETTYSFTWRQYKAYPIPRTRQVTFKNQATHRQGKYKGMQGKLTTQGKRDQKMTKWSVQILESDVGSAGFVELPVTLEGSSRGDQVRTKGVVFRKREER